MPFHTFYVNNFPFIHGRTKQPRVRKQRQKLFSCVFDDEKMFKKRKCRLLGTCTTGVIKKEVDMKAFEAVDKNFVIKILCENVYENGTAIPG